MSSEQQPRAGEVWGDPERPETWRFLERSQVFERAYWNGFGDRKGEHLNPQLPFVRIYPPAVPKPQPVAVDVERLAAVRTCVVEIIEQATSRTHDATQWFQKNDFGEREIVGVVDSIMDTLRRELPAATATPEPEWPADAPDDAVAIAEDSSGAVNIVRLVAQDGEWRSAFRQYTGTRPASWGDDWTKCVLRRPGAERRGVDRAGSARSVIASESARGIAGDAVRHAQSRHD